MASDTPRGARKPPEDPPTPREEAGFADNAEVLEAAHELLAALPRHRATFSHQASSGREGDKLVERFVRRLHRSSPELAWVRLQCRHALSGQALLCVLAIWLVRFGESAKSRADTLAHLFAGFCPRAVLRLRRELDRARLLEVKDGHLVLRQSVLDEFFSVAGEDGWRRAAEEVRSLPQVERGKDGGRRE